MASQQQGAGASQEAGVEGTPEDEAGLFVDVIGANINDVWEGSLNGYTPPRVVLYEQGTNTGCGFGQSAMGPFYCPADQSVYLDLGFWQDMETQLGASGAEFARAYVIAHEFGHHVQTLTGASQQVREAQQRARSQEEANQYSIALELQADCYAGFWAANAARASGGAVALEPGDLEEGLKTANAIGDDMIQKRMQGTVTPENFTHGTAEQRMTWLRRGYDSGDPSVCNTFN
jgi:predicted metalloprotease